MWSMVMTSLFPVAVTKMSACGAAVERALQTPGPVLVQAVVDPYEPPMPPKVTVEQAAKFAASLLKGEPNREKIIATVLADKVREMV